MTVSLTLIRGLPGSGKSTLARTMDAAHFEADMFFTDENGQYHFEPEKLDQAHHWCQQQTECALRNHQSVVVANTFVRLWEMAPYIRMAKRLGAELRVVECHGNYVSLHGVPEKTIATMRRRWQNWQGAEQVNGG
ncbi:AAA family ATPase [Vibrio sp.]|uniref:AAA family ATPase n=1 Tax=Vibrio sp. TaxID=678 RepID=UPI003D14FE95